MIRNRIDPALKILAIAKAITAFFALPKFHFFNQSNEALQTAISKLIFRFSLSAPARLFQYCP